MLAEKVELLDRKFYLHEVDKHPSALANKERAAMLVPVIKKYLQLNPTEFTEIFSQ